jgi:hypothetical protein
LKQNTAVRFDSTAYRHNSTSVWGFAATASSFSYKESNLTIAEYSSNICNYIISVSHISWLCVSHHCSADGSHVGRKLQGDRKVYVYLMITIQKVTTNIQIVCNHQVNRDFLIILYKAVRWSRPF